MNVRSSELEINTCHTQASARFYFLPAFYHLSSKIGNVLKLETTFRYLAEPAHGSIEEVTDTPVFSYIFTQRVSFV